MTFLIDRAGSFNSPAPLFRIRLIRAGWVVVRRGDGLRKSIPIFRKRTFPITRSGGAPMMTHRTNTKPASTSLRLRFLAKQVYALGPHPLCELLIEIVGGAPALPRIERYARLNREHGDFIRANGGDQFPPRLFIVSGKTQDD